MRIAAIIMFSMTFACSAQTRSSQRQMPVDPVHDAIYARFGDPDRYTGSGVGYLHYDLSNGQTITLAVQGNRVTAATITQR